MIIQNHPNNARKKSKSKMATPFFLSLKPLSSATLSFFPSAPTNPGPHALKNLLGIQRSFSKTATSASKNGNRTPSETGCPVPLDQQPINEYQSLSTSFFFSWASSDVVEYSSRLFATGAFFAIFVGLPVSWFGAVGAKTEPIRLVLGSVSSGLFVVILVVVRMYLGWAYVGNRLLSATVEYEETGWYDGQIWVKTAEVLARDRLLGSFTVKPILGRLKNTLLILGTTLLFCISLFINGGESRQSSYNPSMEPGGRAIPGVYNDQSARNFEPDAFGGETVSPQSTIH